jgi:membrane associated rhomboid family serine protease/Flp pilus assembly protein TadD
VHAEESATDEPQQHFLVTNVLVAINVIVFVVMVFKHVPLMSPTSDQIVKWGGNFGPLTLGAQPWRLVTNIFVHIGLPHIIANMWALIVLGRFAESLYGRGSFLAIYFLGGITGSVASLLWNPMGVSAGASGAIFGVLTALIATLYVGKLPMPKHVVRPILWTLVFWAVFQLAYGFWKTGVDNAAHLGGVAAGLILGYPLGHHLGTEAPARHSRERIFTYSLMALGIFCFIVWRLDSYVVQVERARVLLTENKPDQAIAMLQSALQKRPNEAYVHFLIAQSFERKGDVASAERELKQALQLAPDNGAYWKTLADHYVRTQQWENAANSYRKAAASSKDNGISWFDAGVAFRQLDRIQDATDAFKKCVAVNPYFGEAWYQLGMSQLNLKQNKEAVASLQQAAKLMPNNPEAHLWLGNALLSIGQEEASKAEFLKAFQIRAVQQRAMQELQKQQQQREMQQQRQLQQSPTQPASAK